MELEWSGAITYGGKGGYVWPNYDGVYVVAKKINGKLKARYVGQGNIHERMKQHESKNEPNECLKEVMENRTKDVEVYHAKVTNDEDRNNAEYTLWYYYGGSTNSLCNEIVPTGEPVMDLDFPFAKIDLF